MLLVYTVIITIICSMLIVVTSKFKYCNKKTDELIIYYQGTTALNVKYV